MRRLLAAGACAFLFAGAALLSSCSGERPAPDPGPLVFGDAPTVECVVASRGTPLLLGAFLGPSSTDVTIETVELDGMTGLSVVDTFLLNPELGDGYATATDVPTGVPIWDARVRAEGAQLAEGAIANIVVQAELSDESASIPSIAVNYLSAGVEYRVVGAVEFDIGSAC